MSVKTLVRELLESGKLKEILAELEGSENEYLCSSCQYTFSSEKKKRVCPKCKSKKLLIVENKEEPVQIKVTEPPPPIRDKNKLCRSQPVKIKTKVLDTGDFKDETEKFTKKVKFSVSERRDKVQFCKVRCAGSCGQIYEVHPTHITTDNWKCDQCLINK